MQRSGEDCQTEPEKKMCRNQDAAKRIISKLKTIQSDTETAFSQKDLTLLENVDGVCDEVKAKETKLDLWFMS